MIENIGPIWVVFALLLGFGIAGLAIAVDSVCHYFEMRKLYKQGYFDKK